MDRYKKLARQKFPFGPIVGTGRWACVRRCPKRYGKGWRISLFETQEQAERCAARECRWQCLGTYEHFVTTVGPPESPTVAKPKPVEPLPPIFSCAGTK
jgi:hypothetical protein